LDKKVDEEIKSPVEMAAPANSVRQDTDVSFARSACACLPVLCIMEPVEQSIGLDGKSRALVSFELL